jgi:hypothetical protein
MADLSAWLPSLRGGLRAEDADELGGGEVLVASVGGAVAYDFINDCSDCRTVILSGIYADQEASSINSRFTLAVVQPGG